MEISRKKIGRFGALSILTLTTVSVAICWNGASSNAADWSQWRGHWRDGVDHDSPALIENLPTEGLKPTWLSETIPSAKNGGWASPVVSGDSVFLFTHTKTKLTQGDLGAVKYPYLDESKRRGMSAQQYQEYEANRRAEQETRAKAYRFDESVWCLDRLTGKTRWKNQRESAYTRFPQSGSPLVIDNRMLLILGAGRTARCIDAKTGKDIWSTMLPGDFRDEFTQSSFVAVGDLAVIFLDALYGLNLKDGSIRWRVVEGREGIVHTSPVVWVTPAGPIYVCNTSQKKTIGVSSEGKKLWVLDSQAGNSTPVIVGNQLLTYGASRKGGLRCYELNFDQPVEKWINQRVYDQGSSPVVIDGFVYVQSDRSLSCLDMETGSQQWKTYLDIARPRYTSLVAADNKIFYVFDSVLAFSAKATEFQPIVTAKIDADGKLAEEASFRRQMKLDELEKTTEGQKLAEKMWRKKFSDGGPLPCSSPALSDGFLYVRLKNGVGCYDLRLRD